MLVTAAAVVVVVVQVLLLLSVVLLFRIDDNINSNIYSQSFRYKYLDQLITV